MPALKRFLKVELPENIGKRMKLVDVEKDRKKDEKIKNSTEELIEKTNTITFLLEEMERKDEKIKSLEEEMQTMRQVKRQEMEEKENEVDEKDRTWSERIFDGFGGRVGGWFTHLVQGEQKGEEKKEEEMVLRLEEEKPVEKKKKNLNQVVTKLNVKAEQKHQKLAADSSQREDEPQSSPSLCRSPQPGPSQPQDEPQPGPSRCRSPQPALSQPQDEPQPGPSRCRSPQPGPSQRQDDEPQAESQAERRVRIRKEKNQRRKCESEASRVQRKLEEKRVEEAQKKSKRKLIYEEYQTVEITPMRSEEDEEETTPARKKRKRSELNEEKREKTKPGPKKRDYELNESWLDIMRQDGVKFECLNCKHEGKVDKKKYTHESRPAVRYHCRRCIEFVNRGWWPYGYKQRTKKRNH